MEVLQELVEGNIEIIKEMRAMVQAQEEAKQKAAREEAAREEAARKEAERQEAERRKDSAWYEERHKDLMEYVKYFDARTDWDYQQEEGFLEGDDSVFYSDDSLFKDALYRDTSYQDIEQETLPDVPSFLDSLDSTEDEEMLPDTKHRKISTKQISGISTGVQIQALHLGYINELSTKDELLQVSSKAIIPKPSKDEERLPDTKHRRISTEQISGISTGVQIQALHLGYINELSTKDELLQVSYKAIIPKPSKDQRPDKILDKSFIHKIVLETMPYFPFGEMTSGRKIDETKLKLDKLKLDKLKLPKLKELAQVPLPHAMPPTTRSPLEAILPVKVSPEQVIAGAGVQVSPAQMTKHTYVSPAKVSPALARTSSYVSPKQEIAPGASPPQTGTKDELLLVSPKAITPKPSKDQTDDQKMDESFIDDIDLDTMPDMPDISFGEMSYGSKIDETELKELVPVSSPHAMPPTTRSPLQAILPVKFSPEQVIAGVQVSPSQMEKRTYVSPSLARSYSYVSPKQEIALDVSPPQTGTEDELLLVSLKAITPKPSKDQTDDQKMDESFIDDIDLDTMPDISFGEMSYGSKIDETELKELAQVSSPHAMPPTTHSPLQAILPVKFSPEQVIAGVQVSPSQMERRTYFSPARVSPALPRSSAYISPKHEIAPVQISPTRVSLPQSRVEISPRRVSLAQSSSSQIIASAHISPRQETAPPQVTPTQSIEPAQVSSTQAIAPSQVSPELINPPKSTPPSLVYFRMPRPSKAAREFERVAEPMRVHATTLGTFPKPPEEGEERQPLNEPFFEERRLTLPMEDITFENLVRLHYLATAGDKSVLTPFTKLNEQPETFDVLTSPDTSKAQSPFDYDSSTSMIFTSDMQSPEGEQLLAVRSPSKK